MFKKITTLFRRNRTFSENLEKQIKETTNPYLAARLEWNYLFGDLMKAKQNWRLVSFGLLFANIILIGGLLKISSESRLVPYAIKVDELGNSLYAGYLDQNNTVSALQINAFLRQFVINAKSVLTDSFAQKRNTEFVYGASLPSARKLLDSFYRSQNPFQLAKQEIIEVQIKGVIQKSKKTWQIDWIEIHRSLEGQTLSQKSWEALITISLHPVKNPEILNVNPLGIFIEQMNWAEQV